jgi:hypothetical protein
MARLCAARQPAHPVRTLAGVRVGDVVAGADHDRQLGRQGGKPVDPASES